MKKIRLLILLIICSLLILGCNIPFFGKLREAPPVSKPQAITAERLDKYLLSETEKSAFSGSVLVAKNGQILLEKGYGLANIEWNQSNTPETVFRIASLTKGFTAFAILKLEEQGLISLNDPISKYIPNFARGNQVTILHLLTHTSGIRDYTASSDFPTLMGSPVSLNTLVSRVKAEPYDFAPGNKFHYNNSGYILLGYVLEKVSGKNYASILEEQILEPLGMNETAYYENQVPIKNRASGYIYTGGDLYNAPHIELSNVYSAGGMSSTINDLYAWSQAFSNPNLLKEESWKKLFTPVRENYGLGWVIEPLGNHKAIYHTGSIPGFTSILAQFPDEKLTIILLSNLTGAPVKEISENLAAIISGGAATKLPNLKPVTVEPRVLESYVGDYRFALTYTVTINQREGKLFGQLTGQPEFELVPISNTQFVVQNIDIEVTFIQSNGKTDRLLLKQNGREISARKIR